MENLSKIISDSEKLYNNKKTIKYGVNYLLKFYEAYILSYDEGYLKKGFFNSQRLFAENRQSIGLALIYAFFALNYDKKKITADIVNGLKKYNKFIRKNLELEYYAYLFLSALMDIDENGKAEKIIQELEEADNSYADVFLAEIYIKLEESYIKAGDLLNKAYKKGNRSKIFYWVLLEFFNYRKDNNVFTELLIPLFRWGLIRGADLNEIVELNAHKISLSVLESLRLCFKLYKIYSGRNLLMQIIKVLMNNFDYSETAYHIYYEAVNKQIEIKGLNEFLIKTSFRLGIENLGVYPIQEYLSNSRGEDDVKAFVYHIMLNNKKFDALLEKYAFEICSFGLQAYLLGLTGQYYNSIYKYILDNRKEFNVSEEIADDILNILSGYAFCYEISTDNKKANYVRIKQKSVNKMAVYELKDGKAIINAVNDNFLLYLFDRENKEILTGEVKKNKLIQNGDFAFYYMLYKKGFFYENIIIYLASIISDYDYYSEENCTILKRAYELKNISRSLKMKIIFRLGMFAVKENNKELAIKHFKEIDLNYINEKNIEHLIDVFIEYDEISMAVNVLNKKAYLLSDKTVFYVVRKAARDISFNPMVRGFAYELLLKGHYDSSFVEIVKSCYSGSLKEWLELSEILQIMKVPDQRVDEKILKQSILTKRFGERTQRVFCYLYENAEKTDIIEPYIEFICYNIIIENKAISEKTIKILEKEFLKNYDIVIGYALSLAYINQKVTTESFYDIIEIIKEKFEANKINISIFSQQQEKAFHSSYIDKNKAFCYKSSIHKNIFMYYKRENAVKFSKIKMQYFKFGLYIICLEMFYKEKIEYYFSEETESGSIQTEILKYENDDLGFSLEFDDDFYALNNAFINMDKARFDFVEDFISSKIIKKENIIGQLL